MAHDNKEEEDDLGEEYKTNISPEESQGFREQIWKIRHPNDKERKKLWPDDCRPKKRSLRGVATEFVYEWEEDNMWYRCYVLEIHAFVGLKYTLDFSGTENHNIQGTFGFENDKVEANLNPFELETICLVERDNRNQNKLIVTGKWGSCKIHPLILANAIAIEMNKTKEEYDAVLGCGINEYANCDDIRKILFREEILFVDGAFYPNNESLYIDGDQSDKTEEEYIMWRRVGDFWKSFPRIFSDPNNLKKCVYPSFVKQGDVDDAWLMAVISSMALKPELIANLFITKDSANPDDNSKKTDLMFGLIRMKTCLSGLWRDVFVDDFLPCVPYYKPRYCNTPKAIDQLWPSMIEKCYAKIYHCYQRLSGADPRTANPCFAFTDLTGFPSKSIDISDYSKDEQLRFYNQLVEWCDTREVLMCCLCNEFQTNDDKDVEAVGFETGHAYSLLDVRSNGNVQLVCLREPFGTGGWNGDWCDESQLWNQQTRQKFGLNDMKNTGTFWMSYNDFLQYFTSVCVCYCGTGDPSNDEFNKNWNESRMGIDMGYEHKQNDLVVPLIEVNVPNNTIIEFIGIHQQDIRQPGVKQYLDLSIFIYKETNNNGRVPFAYVESCRERQHFEVFGENYGGSEYNDYELITGKYYMMPFTTGNNWPANDGPTRAFTISLHGHTEGGKNKEIKMKITDGYNERKDINNVLLDFVLKFGEKKMWKNLDRRQLKMGNMTLFGGKNNSENEEYTFKMNATELKNTINALTYPDFSQQQNFTVKVGESQLFGVQVRENQNDTSSAVYKYGLSTKKV